MGDYLLGALGIVVSVALFLVGYRQTIGAKKERVKAANSDLERILVRRIVLEKYAPKEAEVSRLIGGKARDFRVRATDLLSEAQVLNTVYTRITESDLIPADQRDEILDRVGPALAESEAAPVQEEALAEVTSSEQRLRATRAAVALMSVLTSVVGGLVAVIPEIRGMEARIREMLPMIASTAGASLAVIAVLFVVTRLRASQEETTNKAKELAKYFEFEAQVRKTLERLGNILEPSGPHRGVDFVIQRGDHKIAVEVKAWSRPVSTGIVRRIIEEVQRSAERIGATEAVIVTAGQTPNLDLADSGSVKLMTLKQLRNYVAHLTA
ncbi:MAG: restriction endonuclease [Phycisphaerales bacterium]|nr:MAG: restriction endonuclease [Phycisphaerales bacterium]